MYKPDIVEEKMREYTEQQTRNFAEAVQKFQYLSPDDTYDEGDENREKPFMDILLKLKDRQKSQNSDILLEEIAKKGLAVTASYLFGEEHVWKPGALEKAALTAAGHNRPETTIFFLKHMEDWSGVFFQKVLAETSHDETRRKLESFHSNYIENNRPAWISKAGYGDAALMENGDLAKAMKQRSLWCVYQFLQKGQTPKKDDLLNLVKEGRSRSDTADLLRVFSEYDQSGSVRTHRNEITYMLADAHLKKRCDNGSLTTEDNLKSLSRIFNDALLHRAQDKYALFQDGNIPGLTKAGAGRDPLAQLFDALPQDERQACLLALHHQAQDEQNLDVIYWFHTTGLLDGVAAPDMFGNLLKCVEQLDLTDDYETQRRLKSFSNRYIALLMPEELTAKNGILLKTALDKKDYDTIAQLMKRDADWPRDLVETYMRDAVYEGDAKTLSLLCQMKQDWQLAFIKDCKTMPSANKRAIDSEVSNIKRSFLGDWKPQNNSEISRSVSAGYATITHLFNFKSAQVITSSTTYEGKGTALQITNFRDFQNSDEIDEAYAKLCISYDDAPPYKGKDDSTRHHIIRRRPS